MGAMFLMIALIPGVISATAPFLLLFVMRFKSAVKKATHEVRKRQSAIVARVEQSLQSMRVVNAFGRQELEEEA